jgi:uncharacterized protein
VQLTLERPDHAYALRGADGRHALVNERSLTRSFIVAPDALVEDWPPADIATMRPADLGPLFALQPELIVLGCGEAQAFAPADVVAACLQTGIGFESMTNSAAARTFNVLASEGRRVVAGFLIAKRID